MKIIFIGENRAEICTVAIKDNQKAFFSIRQQLYKIVPHALTRCRTYDDNNIEIESEEVIIYPENSTYPYHTRGVPFDQESLLAEIDEYKLTRKNSVLSKTKIYMQQAVKTARWIYPSLGLIIGGLIVGWALLTGGGR